MKKSWLNEKIAVSDSYITRKELFKKFYENYKFLQENKLKIMVSKSKNIKIKKLTELLEKYSGKKVVLEGTWSIPKTPRQRQRAKQAIRDLKIWQNRYYNLLGDDLLYDAIDSAIKRGNELINDQE